MSASLEHALLRLGQSIADAAVAGATPSVDGPVSVAEVTTLVDSQSLEEHVVRGIVVADAGSVDGAAGRSLLLISPAEARALSAAAPRDAAATEADPAPPPDPAATETDPAPPPDAAATEAETEAVADPQVPDAPADEEELPPAALGAVAAIADAVNAAAGNALTVLLGQPARYEPARASIVEDPRFVVRPGPVQAVCVTMQAGDVSFRIIQFAPNALVMRAVRAFEDLAQDALHAPLTATPGPSAQTLSGIRLRVWAELGRTELGLADALALPLGTVVELDREADAPVDLVVNGMRFGTGRLIVTDEGEWALELDEVGPPQTVAA